MLFYKLFIAVILIEFILCYRSKNYYNIYIDKFEYDPEPNNFFNANLNPIKFNRTIFVLDGDFELKSDFEDIFFVGSNFVINIFFRFIMFYF